MYIYFFDIDNTLADTEKFLESVVPENYSSLNKKQQIEVLDKILTKNDYLNIPILHNSASNLLLHLLKQKQEVYFITARESKIKEETEGWLEKHKLLYNKNNLIMNANKKGIIIKDILLEKPSAEFAILFDDSMEIHKEISLYNNIISCFP
ncbi:MAG: hypothetical protein FWE18_00300 [Alphaproteobacteria bacterium]|nr:hypothetical protein [Alphaproteobacteria bacterium]